MMTNKDRLDLQFRIFILDLLSNRELTFSEIRGSIARDYHEREYRRQEVRMTLWLLLQNGLISRKDLQKEERRDACRYMYTLTDKGRDRLEYYENQLRELRTNGAQSI